MDPPRFKTGDRVRLKTGKSPIMVLEVDYFHCSCPRTCPPRMNKYHRPRAGWYIRFMYCSSMSYNHCNEAEHRTWREANDFVFYDPQQEETMAQQLYQTKEEKPRFGTFLTRTSTGKIALEMKGSSGDVETFDKNEIEEVTPYTVCIKRYQGGDNNGEERHYEMKPGAVLLNDVLVHLSTGALYRVKAVDTKQKSARKSKNGFFKLQGSFVTTDN